MAAQFRSLEVAQGSEEPEAHVSALRDIDASMDAYASIGTIAALAFGFGVSVFASLTAVPDTLAALTKTMLLAVSIGMSAFATISKY